MSADRAEAGEGESEHRADPDPPDTWADVEARDTEVRCNNGGKNQERHSRRARSRRQAGQAGQSRSPRIPGKKIVRWQARTAGAVSSLRFIIWHENRNR